MARLIKAALRIPELGEPMNSAEIDRSFNQTIDILINKAAEERERNKSYDPPKLPGKQYYLQGHLSEDGMPIPLEESFRATNLEKAKKITRQKVREYHNLEGYAVDLSLFDTPNYPRKVLYSFDVRAKKE